MVFRSSRRATCCGRPIAAQTPLGKQVEGILAKGDLVSDDIVIGIIAERYDQPDCANGAVFDGFPRTIAQAEALDAMLAKRKRKIDVVIELKVDEAMLLGARRAADQGIGGVARAGRQPGDAEGQAGGLLQEHRAAPRLLPAPGQARDRGRHGPGGGRDQGHRDRHSGPRPADSERAKSLKNKRLTSVDWRTSIHIIRALAATLSCHE